MSLNNITEIDFDNLNEIEVFTKNNGNTPLLQDYTNYDSDKHEIDRCDANIIRYSKLHFIEEDEEVKLFSLELWWPDKKNMNNIFYFYICLEIVKDNEVINRYYSQNYFIPVENPTVAVFNFDGETIPTDYDYVDIKAVKNRNVIPSTNSNNLLNFRCRPLKVNNSFIHTDDDICAVIHNGSVSDFFPAFKIKYNKNNETVNSSFVPFDKKYNNFNSISLFKETEMDKTGKFSPKIKTVFVDDSLLFTSSKGKTNQIQYLYYRPNVGNEEVINSEIKNDNGSLYLITIDNAAMSNIGNYGDLTDVFRNQNNITHVNLSLTDNKYLNWTFYGCSNLESAKVFTQNTTEISNCFNNCTNLKNVYIFAPKATTLSNCCGGCANLEEVTITAQKATSLSNCCSGCTNLKKATFNFDSLTNTHYIFSYCGEIGEVRGSLAALVNQSVPDDGLLEGLGKISAAYLKLPNLSTAEHLFASGVRPETQGDCGKLNVDSILYITNYIKTWTDDLSHPITIGIQISKEQWDNWDNVKTATFRISSTDDQNNLNATKPHLQAAKEFLTENGWSVNFKTEDNPVVNDIHKSFDDGTTKVTKCTDNEMVAEYHAAMEFLKSKGWTIKLVSTDFKYAKPDITDV